MLGNEGMRRSKNTYSQDMHAKRRMDKIKNERIRKNLQVAPASNMRETQGISFEIIWACIQKTKNKPCKTY